MFITKQTNHNPLPFARSQRHRNAVLTMEVRKGQRVCVEVTLNGTDLKEWAAR